MDYLEIDLHELVRRILSKWYLVIIPTALIGLGAFLFSYLSGDIYEAKATFTLTDPRYVANFESRYATTNQSKPSESALRTLVLNDEIAMHLFELWESPDKPNATLEDFKEGLLEMDIGDKGMTISLSVTSEDPEQAAFLANTWALLALEKVNSIFYGIDQNQVTYFAEQLEKTQTDLTEASDALVTFAGENQLLLLKNELNAQLAHQMETLQRIRLLETAVLDVEGLLSQLAGESNNATLDPSYRVNYLLIQSRVYNSPVITGMQGTETVGSENFTANSMTPSTGLQINYADYGDETTVVEFEGMLTDWLDVIESQMTELSQSWDISLEMVTTLQSQIQVLENKEDLLEANYALQLETYKIIANKYEEISLTILEEDGQNAKLVSRAIVPDKRLSHNTVRNTAIGLATGGFLGLAVVIIMDWWQTGNKKREAEEA
jgi:uncharacterized protein involved in exopolysaccharide biosynthesis